MLPTLPAKTRQSLLFSEEVGSGTINDVVFVSAIKTVPLEVFA